ncbi:uncharacterized protein LOC119727944 [Patiria miniata]|uniref:Apple domain-containing protein n=1 Tax=Patiria miniata TaxID=46514 RepID=A0A913ZWP8_PATMI|nr:uncharacterized protein LOC119727944 [Patiria miniata]
MIPSAINLITFCLDLLAAVTVVSAGESGLKSCLPSQREHRVQGGELHRFYRGPLRDHALVGQAYRNHTARSHASCAGECLRDDACKSFNFCQDGGLCQLNLAVVSRNMSDLFPSNGCLYFDERPHGKCLEYETTEEYKYKFFVLPPPKEGEPYRLDFAVKGKEDAIFALSEETNENNLYDIDIAAWNNQRTIIRARKHSVHFHARVDIPGIMSEHEYRRLWLTYDSWTIKVGRGHEVAPFIEYHDDSHRVHVKYIGITSVWYDVNWIFYTYCDE